MILFDFKEIADFPHKYFVEKKECGGYRMQAFGNYLKEQREAKNISLKEIAHLTNVTERYLDFIEKNDFEKVPEGPYIRGYISLYATAIGINAHEALDRFDSQCRKRNRAEDIQQEISEHKIRQRSIILSLINKGKWLLLCPAILGLLIFVAYHLLSEDENKSLVLANVQGSESKGLQTTHTMKSEDNIPALTTNDYSKSSSIPGDLQKDMENRVHERAHNFPSSGSAPNPQAEEFPKKESSHHEKNIEVIEATVCTDVKDRKPFGKDDSFQWSTDRVYIWNSIKCDSHLSSIRHIYFFEGKKVSDIVLDIRSPIWRTWSYKAIANKNFIGPWRVDITSADGELLKRVYFEIS